MTPRKEEEGEERSSQWVVETMLESTVFRSIVVLCVSRSLILSSVRHEHDSARGVLLAIASTFKTKTHVDLHGSF